MTTLEVVGQLGIVFALIVLARLSRRLGHMTHAKARYRGFYVSAALLLIGVSARLVNELLLHENRREMLWVLVYDGIPAFALTLAVLFAWRYWSWLLAERD
ncbi:MAG: hypothetical protein IAE80_27035 [Anaerolinea sp.]|nr:hypothetical protein [Anaerolinea sp.]